MKGDKKMRTTLDSATIYYVITILSFFIFLAVSKTNVNTMANITNIYIYQTIDPST